MRLDWTRVRAITRKEFRDYRRNRSVIATMGILPLAFLVLPTVNLLSLGGSASPAAVRKLAESLELGMLLTATFIPSAVAAYSIVGEREQGTLEPVLTTPVRQDELIVGKALAAVVPAVVMAYGLFAVLAVVVRIGGSSTAVDAVWDPVQIFGEAVFAPLLATWATWVGMAISSRASDVRVAQQLSALGSLPMLGLLALFSFRVVTPSVGLAIGLAGVLLVVDSLGWRVISRLLDRERLVVGRG